MMVSVDKAGRVVIPKEVRDQLGLTADASLELDIEGDAIRLTPHRRASRQVVEVDGLPVLVPVEGSTPTDADVQQRRDADQR